MQPEKTTDGGVSEVVTVQNHGTSMIAELAASTSQSTTSPKRRRCLIATS
jgi:hypothetical protein